MAYPTFGTVTSQFKAPTGRPGSTQNPFELALLSAAKLRQATTPTTMRFSTNSAPPSVTPSTPPQFISYPGTSGGDGGTYPGGPGPGESYPGGPGPAGSGSNTGAPATTPPVAVVPGNEPPSAPEPPQGAPNSTPTSTPWSSTTTTGGRTRGDMGVTPGDPNRTNYYVAEAAKLNAQAAGAQDYITRRWRGKITDADVRAFDAYAAQARAKGMKDVTVWDWLAGGKPTQTGNYYFDKAVEYNSYDTPWKGKISAGDVEAFQKYVRLVQSQEGPANKTPHITDWLMMGRPAKPYATPSQIYMRQPESSEAIAARMEAIGTRAERDAARAARKSPTGIAPNATGNGPVTGTGTAPPPAMPPADGGGGGTGGTTPPAGTTPPPTDPAAPQLGNFEEMLAQTIAEVEGRYQPSFQRDRADLQNRLMQTGAITGAVNSGGFTDVVGDELVGLIGKQSAQLGEEISKQTINATQLAMTKYVAEMDDAFKRLQLRTNADLEQKALDLQKYGIDKNFFMEEYKANLALKGQMYSADRQVDAASMHAAASSAAARASAEASRYNADRDYQLGLVNADINREGNILQTLVSLGAQNSDWMKWFLASDPFGIFNGNQVPGDVVVTP